MSITIPELIEIARDLRGDPADGENPEYERALVELIADAAGVGQDGKYLVALAIGIKGIDW